MTSEEIAAGYKAMAEDEEHEREAAEWMRGITMTYTPEQQALIARMKALSEQIDRTMQDNVAQRLVRAAEDLSAALRNSNEVTRLCMEHNKAFREFLDTLVNP
jgi:hypothetical protein